jgi:hypothetical protein
VTDTELILRSIDDVKAEVRAVEGRLNDKIEDLKQDVDARDSEVSDLKLQLARVPVASSSLKRDGSIAAGGGALVGAIVSLVNWLVSK